MSRKQEVVVKATYHVDDVEGDEGAFGAREGPAHLAGVVWDVVTRKNKAQSDFPLRKDFTQSCDKREIIVKQN